MGTPDGDGEQDPQSGKGHGILSQGWDVGMSAGNGAQEPPRQGWDVGISASCLWLLLLLCWHPLGW